MVILNFPSKIAVIFKEKEAVSIWRRDNLNESSFSGGNLLVAKTSGGNPLKDNFLERNYTEGW